METIKGKVLSLDGTQDAVRALVEVEAVACARCAAGRGCGAGLAAGGEATTRRVLADVEPGVAVRPGDAVELGLAGRQLLSAALYAWGIPLAGALSAAMLAWIGGAGDGPAAAVALAGTVLGAVFARSRLQARRCLSSMTPSVVRRLSEAGR